MKVSLLNHLSITYALYVCAAYALLPCNRPEPKDFLWIVIVEGIQTVITAYGIGANDVANCFSTSVGSGSLTLKQACIAASICEFLGAFLLGAQVTNTVRKKIVDPSMYTDQPEILMMGFLCADMAAGMWLLVATSFSLPVSTTHSIIGALIGFGLGSYGTQAVIWQKVGMVVLSWVTAPCSAMLVSFLIFFIVRTFILRSPNSFDRALKLYPVLLTLCLWVNLFFAMYKGAKQLTKTFKKIKPYIGVWICLGVALVISIPVGFLAVPTIRKRVQAQADAGTEQALDVQGITTKQTKTVEVEKDSDVEAPAKPQAVKESDKPKDGIMAVLNNRDIKEEALGDDNWEGRAAQKVHANAEIFEVRTELTFNYIQVVTACFDSFAHGANDVANAIGTMAGCVSIYRYNGIEKKSPVPLWILAMGGLGIVIGLLTWGYKMMEVIGVQLTRITPARGFCIEISSAMTVIVCSLLGIPVSTTHCQVGATVGCGLVEDKRAGAVSWILFAKIFAGWVLTLVVAAGFAAALTGFAIWSPSRMYE